MNLIIKKTIFFLKIKIKIKFNKIINNNINNLMKLKF